MREIDLYFDQQSEPTRSYLLGLRRVILDTDPGIEEAWKYRLPMYTYKGKNLCYIWKDKRTDEPYVGIVKGTQIDDPRLIQGDRKRMKIFQLSRDTDIPVNELRSILHKAMTLY